MNRDLITVIVLSVFLLCAIGVILIGSWMYRKGPTSNRQSRISRFLEPQEANKQVLFTRESALFSTENIGKFRGWINDSLTGFSSERLQLKLSSAYWTITDTEYILIRISGAVIALILGWLISSSILGGIMLAVISIIILPIYLDLSISKRQHNFHNQLLDVLLLVSGAVKSGYSLMQALDLAVKEIPAPASEEFGRVLREMRLGISLEGSLFNLAERMSSDDMQIVVTAIIVNSQVGGNLSQVLESTIATIRDRMHLFGEIRSLTSYARYVGNFLSLMPFIMGFIIFIMAPDFFAEVKTSLISQVILVSAFVGLIIGNVWIRRIVKINV